MIALRRVGKSLGRPNIVFSILYLAIHIVSAAPDYMIHSASYFPTFTFLFCISFLCVSYHDIENHIWVSNLSRVIVRSDLRTTENYVETRRGDRLYRARFLFVYFCLIIFGLYLHFYVTLNFVFFQVSVLVFYCMSWFCRVFSLFFFL